MFVFSLKNLIPQFALMDCLEAIFFTFGALILHCLLPEPPTHLAVNVAQESNVKRAYVECLEPSKIWSDCSQKVARSVPENIRLDIACSTPFIADTLQCFDADWKDTSQVVGASTLSVGPQPSVQVYGEVLDFSLHCLLSGLYTYADTHHEMSVNEMPTRSTSDEDVAQASQLPEGGPAPSSVITGIQNLSVNKKRDNGNASGGEEVWPNQPEPDLSESPGAASNVSIVAVSEASDSEPIIIPIVDDAKNWLTDKRQNLEAVDVSQMTQTIPFSVEPTENSQTLSLDNRDASGKNSRDDETAAKQEGPFHPIGSVDSEGTSCIPITHFPSTDFLAFL